MAKLTPTPQADAPEPTAGRAVREVDETNFDKDVVEESQERLVLVDFWKPGIEPSGKFTPVLEKLAKELNGVFTMARMNIEANPRLSKDLGVTSAPFVFAFLNGRPVDGIAGVLSEKQIKDWLEHTLQVAKTALSSEPEKIGGVDHALVQAAKLLRAGEAESARSIYAEILDLHPDNPEAFAGSLRCMLTIGHHGQAKKLLSLANSEVAQHKTVMSVHKALELIGEAQQTLRSIEELEADLSYNPDEHQARLELALAHYAANDTKKSIEALLEIAKRDKDWKNESAKKYLVKVFDSLGPRHPHTFEGWQHFLALFLK